VGKLLGAARLLNRRGAGSLAWAAPFRDDPIAFLLDSMSDGMIIWAVGGELLYQNRAAAELGSGSSKAIS
jgi:PAS domain-containing protein